MKKDIFELDKTAHAIWKEGTYMDPSLKVGHAIIFALFDYGCNEKAVKEVYQSKHVRWFFDMNPEMWKCHDEKLIRQTFLKYLKSDCNGVMAHIMEWS